MRRISTKNRIIALALCFLMVMSLFPSNAFANTDAETSVVGRTATFADDYVNLYSDPANWQYSIVAASELPQSVVITEVSGDYYKITGADGAWPEDYAGLNYVQSTELKLDEIATPDPSESSEPTESSEPSTTESEGSCACCDNCTNAEGCACACENNCAFCDPEVSCACCKDCTNDETCTCQCEECTFCEEEDTTDPTDPSEPETAYDSYVSEDGRIKIEGTLPVGTTVNMTDVTGTYGDLFGDKTVYDISLSSGQPDGPVKLSIAAPGLKTDGYAWVTHIIEDVDHIANGTRVEDAALAARFPKAAAAAEAAGYPGSIFVERFSTMDGTASITGDGKIQINATSFSIYYAEYINGTFVRYSDNGAGYSDANAIEIKEENPVYCVTRGQTVVVLKTRGSDETRWNSNDLGDYIENFATHNTDNGFLEAGSNQFCTFDIRKDCEFYTVFTLTWITEGGLFTPSRTYSVQFIVVPDVQVFYNMGEGPDESTIINMPTSGTTYVMGNDDEAAPCISITLPSPSAPGYTLTGWKNGATAGTVYSANAVLKLHPDLLNTDYENLKDVNPITFTAQWEAIDYTVNFNGNGATSGSMDPQKFTYDETESLTANAFTRTGYEFLGWSRDANATVASITDQADGSTLLTAEDTKYIVDNQLADYTVNLYAVWHPKKYTVSFDSDGGTITPEAFEANCNASVDVTDKDPGTKTGYTFTGWTSTDVTVTGNAFTMPAKNVTLKAQWAPNQYTIDFVVSEDGVTEPASITQNYNTDWIAPDAERTNYNLIGWTTTQGSTTAEYTKNSTYKVLGDLILYPVWQIAVGDIQVNKTIVDNDANENPVTNQSFTFTLTTSAEGNYAYTIYKDEGEVHTTGTIGNDGTFDLQEDWYIVIKDLPAGSTYIVTETALDGYTAADESCSGWITAGETQYHTFTNTFKKTANYTVKHWLQNLDDDRYTEVENDRVITFGDIGAQTTATAKDYTGFTLSGSIAQQTINADGSTVVNIYYDRIKSSVTYSVTGAPSTYTAPAGQTNVKFGAAVEVENVPSVDGYTFTGWTTDDATVTNGTFTMPATDVTITGEFKAIEYTITYDLGGGALTDGKTNPKTYTIVSDDITLNNPTRTGYTFAGWTGTGLNSATETVTISKGSTDDREYAAQWEINMVTLTIHSKGADQSIFEVKGTTIEDESVSLTVAFNGTDTNTKTIIVPAGTYNVTPLDNWSWRYGSTNTGGQGQVEKLEGSLEYTFTFGVNNPYWLDGSGYYSYTIEEN